MKSKVITLDSKAAGEIELADEVFAAPVRRDILARMVNYQLAKRRSISLVGLRRGFASAPPLRWDQPATRSNSCSRLPTGRVGLI